MPTPLKNISLAVLAVPSILSASPSELICSGAEEAEVWGEVVPIATLLFVAST